MRSLHYSLHQVLSFSEVHSSSNVFAQSYTIKTAFFFFKKKLVLLVSMNADGFSERVAKELIKRNCQDDSRTIASNVT